MQTNPKRGLGQSPPTAILSNNFIRTKFIHTIHTFIHNFIHTIAKQLLLRSVPVYATFIKILNVHTHQYLLFFAFASHTKNKLLTLTTNDAEAQKNIHV